MNMREEQDADNKPSVTPCPTTAPVSLSIKLDIWKVYNDKYLRYVTMWFTAATLAVVILSFCIKTLIVDRASFFSKSVVGAVAAVVALAAFGLSCIIRPRAYRFAEHITTLETLLSKEEGLHAYFRPLPRRPMMKLLIDVSAIMSLVVSVLIIFILVLLNADTDIFSLLNIGDG